MRAVLPGERVLARPVGRRGDGYAAEAEVLEPSPERVAPPCPHFGPCGGCALQHWRDDAYLRWKTGQVTDALRRAGVADLVPLAALARTPPGARRRLSLGIERTWAGSVGIGLRAHRSHSVVNMHACPILHPALFAVVQALRQVLPRLSALRASGEVEVNLLDSGPDLVLRTDGALSAADRAQLAAFADAEGVSRIAWAQGSASPEPACVLRPSRVRFAGQEVEPPPSAFLQASLEGETAIRDAVVAAIRPAVSPRARVVELYAGCGTLTAALAACARRVDAYEGDPTALAALRRAAIPGVVPMLRNLVRQPLQPPELGSAAAVALDPPWSGAGAQMPPLAAARVPRIAYVSCNPAALARDAAVLVRAGYTVIDAVPIDQFLWSARVEAVVTFALPERRRSLPSVQSRRSEQP